MIARVSVNADGQGVEAAARTARYAALAEQCQPGDLLLTAHHQNDQAETLMLNLLRGSGAAGLAAMPARKPFAQGWHLRPLLSWPRSALETYAEEQKLSWIDDPSNEQLRFDRNYLRHRVMPALSERWPSALDGLERAAHWQAEQLGLLHALARLDRERVDAQEPGCLSVRALLTLDAARRRNLLRQWLHEKGLPTPPHLLLQRPLDELLHAAVDGMPVLHWAGAELRRYGDDLHAMQPLAAVDSTQCWPWPADCERIDLPWAQGGLSRAQMPEPWRDGDAELRLRRGGERFRPQGKAHAKPLKDWFQHWRVPPWRRDRVALVYVNEELVGLCLSADALYWAESG